MQGINRIDSWAQFVSLVQDARTRSQALSTVNGPAKTARRTINQVAAAPVRVPQTASAVAAGRAPDMPAVKTKALGSFFDAYA